MKHDIPKLGLGFRKMHAIRDRRCGTMLLAAALVMWAAWSVGVPPAFAQAAHPPVPQASEAPRGAAPAGEPGGRPRAQNDNAHRLPADSVTEHTVELPGRTLHFTATAGAIPLLDAESLALQAEVAYAPIPRGRRPTAPSPSCSTAVRVRLRRTLTSVRSARGGCRSTTSRFSGSTALAPNAETWLDFTDLVFIDPVGTGYSRTATSNENARRSFFSVDGDANALAVMIRKWVEKNGRQGAVKFVVGESYGGFRVPKVARALTGQGVGVRGLVMISPVLDFTSLGNRRHDPMNWVRRLPSMAATVLEGTGPFDRERLREVESYASGDYLHDLMQGEKDNAAVERIDAADRRLYRTRPGGGETARGADRQRDVPARAQPPARPRRERV